MPTATMTIHNNTLDNLTVVPLKSSAASSRTLNSTIATLRSLYPRAAKAFLHRDVALTHSLLTSAFSILGPPYSQGDDGLTSHRRKWDILRVTFETTLYASPPQSENPEAFPAPLRANQMLSPQSLVSSLHSRSLQLFTPMSSPQKAISVFLPSQVLVTLVLASLKLGCADVGRGIIEDWLARRSQDSLSDDKEEYAKILELYCLQVLPRLEEWDYAADFLQYERELPQSIKNNLAASVQALHAQTQEMRNRPSPILSPVILPPSAESSRTVSPAPSVSTSSESSNSTHTATPLSPRPDQGKGKGKMESRGIHNMTHLTPPSSSSSSSQSISSIATSRTVTPSSVYRSSVSRENGKSPNKANGHAAASAHSHQYSRTPLPRPPRSQSLQPSTSATTRAPSILAIIKSYLDSMISNTSKSKLVTLLLLFVILPTFSFLFRLRRRRMIAAGNNGTADEVRRRLRGLNGGAIEAKGVVGRFWEEFVRAIGDTVRMGGRGLV